MARPRITEDRRRQILEAATGVIAERGVCDARIADVASRIGASPALILYYFPSKDALLAEALAYRDQQFFQTVADEVGDGARAAVRLVRLIEASCPPPETLDRTDNEWLLWLDVWTRSRHDAQLSRARAEMDRLFRATIAGIVQEGIAAGEFLRVDPHRFAVMLSALIDGLAIQVLLQDPSVDAVTMRDLCLELCHTHLGPGVTFPVGAASSPPAR